jgi:hypothetical protein
MNITVLLITLLILLLFFFKKIEEFKGSGRFRSGRVHNRKFDIIDVVFIVLFIFFFYSSLRNK